MYTCTQQTDAMWEQQCNSMDMETFTHYIERNNYTMLDHYLHDLHRAEQMNCDIYDTTGKTSLEEYNNYWARLNSYYE